MFTPKCGQIELKLGDLLTDSRTDTRQCRVPLLLYIYILNEKFDLGRHILNLKKYI